MKKEEPHHVAEVRDEEFASLNDSLLPKASQFRVGNEGVGIDVPEVQVGVTLHDGRRSTVVVELHGGRSHDDVNVLVGVVLCSALNAANLLEVQPGFSGRLDEENAVGARR